MYGKFLDFPANNSAGSIAEVIGSWFPECESIIKWLIYGVWEYCLLYEWWIARKQEYHWFLWTACITLLISQWIGIPTSPWKLCNTFYSFCNGFRDLGQSMGKASEGP